MARPVRHANQTDQVSGRRVPDNAAAEVSLGLVMSRCTTQWRLDLAVTLRWRLAGTGGALAARVIDLPRARLIAEATSLLEGHGDDRLNLAVQADQGAASPRRQSM